MATDPVTVQICRVQNTQSNYKSEMQQTRHFSVHYCFRDVCILVTDNAWQIENHIKEHAEQLWKGDTIDETLLNLLLL